MGKNIVRLAFNDDAVTVSAKHDDQEVESTVKVLMSQGAPNNVALDASFLLDYLKGKEGIVTLSWESQGAPILFNHQKNPTVLIMPMSVAEATAEAEPAEEAEVEPAEEAEAEPAEEPEPAKEEE